MFIKKFFTVTSQSLHIFKVFRGLKFRFEVLNVLIAKGNIPIKLWLFKGILKPLQARRIV